MTGKRGWRTSCASTVNIGRGSYSRSVRSVVVSLEPTERDPFYKLSLEDEKQNQHRDSRHVRGSEQERVVREVLALEESDADGEDAHLGVAGHNQGPEELVPRPERDQEGEGGQRRPCQWEVDLPVDLEGVSALDGRRLLIVGRDREKVLANEERAEGTEEERHDQSLVGIEPAYLPHQRVVGDDQHLIRHHESGEEQEEEGITPREAQAGEGKGSHRGEKDLSDDAPCGDDDRIGVEAQEGHLVEDVLVVLPAHLTRDQAWRDREEIFQRLERGGDRPDERQQEDHADRQQRHMQQDAGEGVPQTLAFHA